MLSAISNVSRSNASGEVSSHKSHPLNVLAMAAEKFYRADCLVKNAVADGSDSAGTAIRDFNVKLGCVPGTAEDKPGEVSETSETGRASKASKANETGNNGKQPEFVMPQSSERHDNKYECNICHKTFKTNYLWTRHKRAHELVECNFCHKMYKNKSSLLNHVAERHNEESSNHQCDICGKRFRYLCRLEKHHRINNKKSFQCELCFKQFHFKAKLHAHNNQVHRYKNATHKCNMCNRKFNSGSGLLMHKFRAHSKEEDIKHRRHAELLSRKTKLNAHVLLDHNYTTITEELMETSRHLEKQDIDGNPVVSRLTPMVENPSISDTQANRSRIESKGKNYCSECNKSFKRGTALRQHNIDKHNAPTAHKCKYCQKGFAIMSCLKRHEVEKHKDQVDGRHNCSYCNNKFWDEAERIRHIIANHPEKVKNSQFKCACCGSVFIDNLKFKAHTIRKHGIKW